MLADLAQLRTPLFKRRSKRVVGHANGPSGRSVKDQRLRPLWVRRGEERADLSAFARSEQHRCLRAGRVQDSTNVVDPRFERTEVAWPIRESGAALIEED